MSEPDHADYRPALAAVLVRWRDAHADLLVTSWAQVDEIEDTGPYLIHSLGWLVPDAKRGHVTIAQSLDYEVNVDTVLHIPADMVQDILTLPLQQTGNL